MMINKPVDKKKMREITVIKYEPIIILMANKHEITIIIHTTLAIAWVWMASRRWSDLS